MQENTHSSLYKLSEQASPQRWTAGWQMPGLENRTGWSQVHAEVLLCSLLWGHKEPWKWAEVATAELREHAEPHGSVAFKRLK